MSYCRYLHTDTELFKDEILYYWIDIKEQLNLDFDFNIHKVISPGSIYNIGGIQCVDLPGLYQIETYTNKKINRLF